MDIDNHLLKPLKNLEKLKKQLTSFNTPILEAIANQKHLFRNHAIEAIANRKHLFEAMANQKQFINNVMLKNIVLSPSPAFEIQQRICETVSSVGLKATQVSAFEGLPEETQEMIRVESLVIEKNRATIKSKPGTKVRHRNIEKVRKETFRAQVADWIAIILFFDWLNNRFVTDPDFRQNIANMTEELIQYIEYLCELLQTMK